MVNDVTVKSQSDFSPIEIIVNTLLNSMYLTEALNQIMAEYTEFAVVSSLLYETGIYIAENGSLFKFLGDLFCNWN